MEDPLKYEKDLKRTKEFLGKNIEKTENLEKNFNSFVDSINQRYYNLLGRVEQQERIIDVLIKKNEKIKLFAFFILFCLFLKF
jgi:hypothetical protein